MLSIYKYPLILEGRQTLELPQFHRVLAVQFQGEQLCLWALVDPSLQNQRVEISVVGTGFSLPKNPGRHLATVQQGPYVWHVFMED